MNTAEAIYKSIKKFSDLERLVLEGQTEGLYLEVKAPTDSIFDKSEREHLAQTVSAFSNTEGGVLMYGVESAKHDHNKIDTIVNLTTVGQITKFSSDVLLQVTLQTNPSVTNYTSKIIKRKASDRNGILLIHIPKSSQPTQSNFDNLFYIRNGDGNAKAPYHTIARLFTLSNMPDLKLSFAKNISKKNEEGSWDIKLTLTNNSRKAPEKAIVVLDISNPSDIETLECLQFKEVSDLNPGKKLYSTRVNEPIFKGMRLVIGTIRIKMARGQRRKRVLNIFAQLLASDMDPIERDIKINISSNDIHISDKPHITL